MLGMLGDKKKIASAILEVPAEVEPEKKLDFDQALNSIASSLIQAIEAKDASKVKAALQEFYDAHCSAEEYE